jgi:hypothetical protein
MLRGENPIDAYTYEIYKEWRGRTHVDAHT